MRTILTILAVPAMLALAACATNFTGEPHYPGGPAGCAATCQQAGLEMSGFIFSGEFSSSCVCRPPRAMPPPTYAPPAGTAPTGPSAPVSYADDGEDPMQDDAAAVGVIMQMRRSQQQAGSGSN